MANQHQVFRQIASSIVLGMGLGLLPLTSTLSLTDKEMDNRIQKITVMIGGAGKGTGIIIQKKNNIYTVLTNCHVIAKKDAATGKYILKKRNYLIKTEDQKQYNSSKNLGCLNQGEIDLGLLQFTSEQKYDVALLENRQLPTSSERVYIGGWQVADPRDLTCEDRCYNFITAIIYRDTDITTKNPNGYNLIFHTALIKAGMSGSGIFNTEGKLVGIYSAAELNPRTQQLETVGVPIRFFCDAIKNDKSLAGVCEPKDK